MHTRVQPLSPTDSEFSRSVEAATRKLFVGAHLRAADALLGRLFREDVNALSALAARADGPAVFSRLILETLHIGYSCSEDDIAGIPAAGPLLVANHPFGLVEAPVMWSILSRARSDIKF